MHRNKERFLLLLGDDFNGLIHNGTLDIMLMKRFDRLSPSDQFMDAPVGNEHRHPVQTRDLAEPMSRPPERKTEK